MRMAAGWAYCVTVLALVALPCALAVSSGAEKKQWVEVHSEEGDSIADDSPARTLDFPNLPSCVKNGRYDVKIQSGDGSIVRFRVPKGHNIFEQKVQKRIRIRKVRLPKGKKEKGNKYMFCHACVKGGKRRFGDTCWGVLPRSDDAMPCGCTSNKTASAPVADRKGFFYNGYGKGETKCAGRGGGWTPNKMKISVRCGRTDGEKKQQKEEKKEKKSKEQKKEKKEKKEERKKKLRLLLDKARTSVGSVRDQLKNFLKEAKSMSKDLSAKVGAFLKNARGKLVDILQQIGDKFGDKVIQRFKRFLRRKMKEGGGAALAPNVPVVQRTGQAQTLKLNVAALPGAAAQANTIPGLAPGVKYFTPLMSGQQAVQEKKVEAALQFLPVERAVPDEMELQRKLAAAEVMPSLVYDPVILHGAKKVDELLVNAHEEFKRKHKKDCKGTWCGGGEEQQQ